MNVLVIDVGGTHIKVKVQNEAEIRKCDSGQLLTPTLMIERVLEATKDWQYDRVAIGYPGPVLKGAIAQEPVNLGAGWVDFDFAATLERPVRIINDAESKSTQ